MAKKVTTLQRPLRSPYGNLNADYTDENDNAWPSVQAYLDSVAARHGTVPKRMVILVDIDGVETEMTNRGQETTSTFVPADGGSGILDAPSDGKAYVRKDEEWVEGVEKSEVDELSNTLMTSDRKDGFYITDANGNVIAKIDEEGLAVTSISANLARKSFEGITFWGSSSTEASWVKNVAANLNMKFYWGGSGGENIFAIMGRMGVLPLRIKGSITIPAQAGGSVSLPENYKFYVKWKGAYKNATIWVSRSTNEYKLLINPCYIAGVKGTIGGGGSNSGNPCYFERIESGSEITTLPYEPVFTYGFQQTRDSIWFLACHFNGGEADATDLVDLYKKMVSCNTSGRVLILGRHRTANTEGTITSPTMEFLTEREQALEDEFGLMFFNTRQYMSTYGWSRYKELYPGEYDQADETDAANGIPPNCLYENDTNVHFNSRGYAILTEAITERLKELGYNLFRLGGDKKHPIYQ